MALRNVNETPTTQAATQAATTVAPATSFPPFEGDDDVVTEVKPVAAQAATASSDQTAVAVVKPEASAVVLRKPILDKNTAMRGLQNAIPTAELETMAIGVFPRITTTLEGFMVDKNKKNLGTRIRIEVLSWSHLWMVTTGRQNDAEANKLIRSSYNEKTFPDGTLLDDYVAFLKSEGYEQATKKNYCEVYAMLKGYMELKGDSFVKVEIPEDEQGIHQVSLGPQSLGQWGKYLLESGIRKARGHADDSIVTLVRESKTIGSNTFALATFTPRW